MILPEYSIKLSHENLQKVVAWVRKGPYDDVAALMNDLAMQVGLQEQRADEAALQASVADAAANLPAQSQAPMTLVPAA